MKVWALDELFGQVNLSLRVEGKYDVYMTVYDSMFNYLLLMSNYVTLLMSQITL